ncbi:hypothetical protein NAL89_19880, partial [Burkholderia glumae]|nr:hypothetical protein [Burkholderia glumae]
LSGLAVHQVAARCNRRRLRRSHALENVCWPQPLRGVVKRPRTNNRAENSHQPTRERERRMRGFRDLTRTQAFLESFGPIRQHFALKRHLLRASLYRKHLAVRFSTWRELTEVTQNPSTA